jgi:methionyl-tRNA synthetase
VTAEVLRIVAILAQPVLPTSMKKLLDGLGVADDARDFAHVGEAHALVSGAALPAPAPIFPRYVEAEIDGAKT